MALYGSPLKEKGKLIEKEYCSQAETICQHSRNFSSS